MKFVKIEDGVVVQKQPYAAPGFIEAPDDVCCGQLLQEDGSFSNPPTDPDAEKMSAIRAKKAELAALDLKLIRALREGGTDPETGELYLDKYAREITETREAMEDLEQGN